MKCPLESLIDFFPDLTVMGDFAVGLIGGVSKNGCLAEGGASYGGVQWVI